MNLFLILFTLACLAVIWAKLLSRSFRSASRPRGLVLNAAADFPPSEQTLSLLPTAAHAANVIVTRGAAGYYAVCGANDEPIGIVQSPVAQADLGRPQAVHLLGLYRAPLTVVASEALATSGTRVFTAASGQIQDLPAVAGVYTLVGRNVSPFASGKPGVLEHWQPRTHTVLAAMASSDGTAAGAADLAALKAEVEKLGDDFRRYVAAAKVGTVEFLA